MPVTQSQQDQPRSHLFQPHQAESRVSGMADESLGSRGRMGRFTASALVCLSPEGMVRGSPPPLGCLPTQGCWFLGCLGALLGGQCQSMRVLLNRWRSGEVLAAGAAPEGLASTCSVAVLQGPVMDKQLDKLPFFFLLFFFSLSLNADTVTHTLRLA